MIDVVDFLLGIFIAGSFKPRPARPKIAPEKPRQPQIAYTGGQQPAAWSAEADGRAAEIAAVMDGRMSADDCQYADSASIARMTRTVHDVKSDDGEVIRQRVNWKG